MGVTNACPRPGLSALYQEHVCPSPRPGTWAGAGGRPGPPWKHAHAHVCTLLSNTHAHTRYILLCTCSPRTHIHTDTVIHRQHCACTPSAQLHTGAHGRTYVHTAYTYPYLHTAHSLHVHAHTPRHRDTLKLEYIHVHTVTHICTLTHIYTHVYYPCPRGDVCNSHVKHRDTHINTAACAYPNAHLNMCICVTATYAYMTKRAHMCVHIKLTCM